MGIGTIILNLLYSKLLRGTIKMLLEKITMEGILGTGAFRSAFLCKLYAVNYEIPVPKMREGSNPSPC